MADEAVQQDDTVVASENASTQPSVEASQTAEQAKPVEATAVETPDGEAKAEDSEGLLSRVEDKAKPEDTVPEQYEFSGDALDEVAITDLAALAKDSKLTTSQASILAQGYEKAMSSLIEQNKKEVAENIKAFESDPKGKENALLAKKALDHLGLTEHFVSRGYDTDYTMIKALSNFGKMLSEDKIVTGETASPATPKSPYGSEWK